jgi:hypothetical protein
VHTLDSGIAAFASDVVHNSLKAVKVGGVQCASNAVGCNALKQEWNTEEVEAFVDEVLCRNIISM